PHTHLPSSPLTATPPSHISTLSLHDALPISLGNPRVQDRFRFRRGVRLGGKSRHRVLLSTHPAGQHGDRYGDEPQEDDERGPPRDRKSTRLNSSHQIISYAVFCLKKKRRNNQ